MRKDELIGRIRDSFDGVARPKDITLHVAEAHDNHDYERNELHRLKDFVGPWQEIPEAHILACPHALPHLDGQGLRYYLPAYMVWYLLNPNVDSWAYDSTLYTFDDSANDESLSAYFSTRFSVMSDAQLRVCRDFVVFCMEDKEGEHDYDFATEVYERYWSKLR